MSIIGMIIYLKQRGFIADVRYDDEMGLYVFTVTNSAGRVKTKYFKMPLTRTIEDNSAAQIEFLDSIIGEFKMEEYIIGDIKATKDVASLYPKMFMQLARGNGKTVMLNNMVKAYLNSIYGSGDKFHTTPNIKDVIFNDPATIVLWADGTKTVVKTQEGDEYDPEKGLAMAISKKALGNKHEYYNVFKKWMKNHEKREMKKMDNNLKKLAKAVNKGLSDGISTIDHSVTGAVQQKVYEFAGCKCLKNKDAVEKQKGYWTRIYDAQSDSTFYECSMCNCTTYGGLGNRDDFPSRCEHCNSEMHVPGHLELENGVPVKKEVKDEQHT